MTVAAVGIDLGGSKSEVRLFDQDWGLITSDRVVTPKVYDDMVDCVAGQVRWALDQAGRSVPVGVGAAGHIDGQGLAVTANLPASGRPLPADIVLAAGHPITYVNDSRALALSEAVMGAGRGYQSVMSLILGTGVGGGLTLNGSLRRGPTGTGGEFGHLPAPAALIADHGLPIFECGCGRRGCIETYIAGPGLSRLAHHLIGTDLTPEEISEGRGRETAPVWALWAKLVGELLITLVITEDPDIFVLGGGLSRVPGVVDDLGRAMSAAQIPGLPVPQIVLAEGGDASGARGAAIAALQEASHAQTSD